MSSNEKLIVFWALLVMALCFTPLFPFEEKCENIQTISLSSKDGRHELTFSESGDVLEFSTSGAISLDGMEVGCQTISVIRGFSFEGEFGWKAYIINISEGNSVVVQ